MIPIPLPLLCKMVRNVGCMTGCTYLELEHGFDEPFLHHPETMTQGEGDIVACSRAHSVVHQH